MLMSESDDAVGAIFDGALQQPPDRRAAYVRGACAGDLVLLQRVEALLLALESAGGFMKGPAVAPPPRDAPTADEEPGNPRSAPGEPMAQAPADDAVGQTLGRYRLLERIGEGGCGVVYVAEQSEPVRRRVAVKVIKLGMDTRQVILRFEAERQALALMDHPNIAKVLDGGASETGRPYFAMELVRGVPMTQYCNQTQLTTRQRLELFIPVCQAIQHAHQKGIVHRDIKPSNILVTLHDGVPVPKVIDFGIAKAIEGRLTDGTVYTQLHQFVGTPAYMSPEQAEMTGLDIDTRSDIYSLGVLLYELLAGATPFDAKELMASGLDAMRRVIREQEPMRPSTRLMQLQCGVDGTPFALRQSPLPTDLDWIVMKCLEKDRTRRYATANGLAFDLQRHLNDEPVLARPPSAVYRFRKAFRRHRLVFFATAVVAVTLVGGIGLTTFQTFAARKAQRETEAARQAELKANENLRFQVGETEKAKWRAEDAARSEGEQRLRAEEALGLMQVQKAEELFVAQDSSSAIGFLGRVLRAHPSNEIAAARMASAILLPFVHEQIRPLVHQELVNFARFSPDGLRVVTASRDGSARVWDARTGDPVTAPLRHEPEVCRAEFSPDGRRVVTASRDGSARVWDARTGESGGAPLRHAGEVLWAEFDPDGLRVVTASRDRSARVWDARTGQPVGEPLRHEHDVHSARFGPGGLQVVTASWDGSARVWDARTGEAVTVPLRHEAGVAGAQFSPDGSRVVTAAWDGTARVWDARSGQAITPPIRHERHVVSAQFSPDGSRVLTASWDGTARVWDARSGEPLTPPLRHAAELNSAQFSPDGLRLVTASADLTARIWDARTGEPLVEPLRHGRNVLSAEFSPDGSQVVTGCGDYTARVWAPVRGAEASAPLRHGGEVFGAQFSPDGWWVVAASDDQTARVWEAGTGRPATRPLQHAGRVREATFSPDGLRVATASDDRTARIWDARTGQPVTPPLPHADSVMSVGFSADGLRLVTACTSAARVWDTRTGQPVSDLLPDPGLSSARFNPDGWRVVTAACGNWARVWDVRTSRPVGERLLHKAFVVAAQFSPGGEHVATASHDFTARVWDAQTSQPVTGPLRHREKVVSAQFSPDGLWVVTASLDRTARVWEARSGKPVGEPLRHAGAVWFAQFSPDGSRVVTASEDRTVRVWHARTGQPVSEPLRHAGAVHAAGFSPDGLRVVTACTDHTARLWDVTPPPLPVPDWFLDWAEVRVGRHFAARDGTEGVPFAEQQSQRERVRSRTDTGFYTRLAQWVETDPASRSSSPHAMPPPASRTSPDSAP